MVRYTSLKTSKTFPLWISPATNYNNQPLGLKGAEKIIEEALAKAIGETQKALSVTTF